jgi:glycosyltransferase involved in cell wall biosynthesis
MKIGISAYATDSGKSGISQYAANIIGRLPALGPEHQYTVFINNADADWARSWHPDLEIVSFPDWTANPVASIFWHLTAFPAQLRRHQCEVVFMPAANRRLGWRYGIPSVGTVHDFSQLHVPQKYDALRMFYIMRVLPRMMRRLTRVISVSESTQRDLESFAGVDPGRIRVVYNGADLKRFITRDRTAARAVVSEELGLPDDFLLYLARLEHPGKNHVRLLEAFDRLKRETGLPHKLVLVGSRWNGAELIEAKVKELGLEKDVIFPGFVPNETLPALYAAADALVFPSLFEGFGIPVLEAMACGTPVCASNVSSIPEVVGNAGLLFDPLDPQAIADAMGRILQDQDLRKQLTEAGLTQAARFTWEDAAAQVLEELMRAAAGK